MVDNPDWGTYVVRGESQVQGSPFTVASGGSQTITVTPDSTAHGLGVFTNSISGTAFITVIGHQTGVVYCAKNMDLFIGALICPIAIAIDQQYDVSVFANLGGTPTIYVVSIDDIVSTGLYTDVPVYSPVGNNFIRSIPVPPDANYYAFNTSGGTPSIAIAGSTGVRLYIEEAVYTLYSINATLASPIEIQIQDTTASTILYEQVLSVPAVAGAVDRLVMHNIVAPTGHAIALTTGNTVPPNCGCFISASVYEYLG